MAIMKPFSCLRPARETVAQVAALPYDVFSEDEARAEVMKNPRSFLKITRPEVQFPQGEEVPREMIYEKARDQIEEWLHQGVLVEDTEPAFYIYEQTIGGHHQTGLVGCASVDDYLNRVVCEHEDVRQDKLEDRIRHISVCEAQTGPVFLAYNSQKEIAALTEQIKESQEPLYEFVSQDGVANRIWKVSQGETVQKLEQAFGGMEHTYIADGHHRAMAASKVCLRKRDENPEYTGEEPFNYFLCVAFPEDQLRILPYNRVVTDLNGYTPEEFLKAVGEKFDVVSVGSTSFYPKFKGIFGMLLDGKWYQLAIKKKWINGDPVEGLDVSMLQNYVLAPILGIEDPRTDKRIDFVGGIRGLRELEKRCRTDMRVAFSLYPTSIRELFAVAGEGRLMPPKSTWFEPKLSSGLFLHRI